jgi:hypothetical protein|nr:MAG TPA: Major tail protein [Caudoviricetes sp.]
MARIDLSTAGVSIQYAAETSAGTRPTSGYQKLTGIKSIPDLDPEPSSLDTTTLDETEYKTYIPGLKDVGGAIQFGANNSEQFQTDWADLVEAATEANASGKAMWFAVVIPGLTKSFYFAGTPSPLGLSAIEVDSVLEISGYITPSKIVGWETKPTDGI